MNSEEINSLFIETEQSIKDTSTGFELRAEQLLVHKNTSQVQVLFDLAQESIQSPESTKRYVEKIRTSDEMQVENTELTTLLSKTEEAIHSGALQFASLKKISVPNLSSLLSKIEGEEDHSTIIGRHFKPAGPLRRMFAFGIDSIFIGLLALVAAVLIIQQYYPESYRSVVLPAASMIQTKKALALDQMHVITCSCIFVICLLLSPLFYFSFFASFFGATLGMKSVGTKLLPMSKPKVSFWAGLVWGLSMPVSYLLLGYLGTILPARRTLHDWIADVFVAKTSG